MGKIKEYIKTDCPHLTTFVQLKKQQFKVNANRKEYREIIDETCEHYKQLEDTLRKRAGKLRIGAYVPYDTSFSAYSLFDLLISKKDLYEVSLVVIPVTCRGREHLVSAYHKTKESLSERFGKEFVMDGWNETEDSFIDCSSFFDLVYLANPYDSMVNEIHGVQYLSKKDILPFHINYSIATDIYSDYYLFPTKEYSLFWKVFTENKIIEREIKKYQLCKGRNLCLTGYSKMDSFFPVSKDTDKKVIILAPHHTVNYDKLPMSNFLAYYDLILELPHLFPDIHFVFRPHPLLFTNIINDGIWDKERVTEYIHQIEKAGIEYSTEGDYMNLFNKSDAIIHDCISFIGEYLYTDKPCCFLIKKNYFKYLSPFGKKCIKSYYKAESRTEIIDFITNVVINKNDPLLTKRKSTKSAIAINYPHVSEMILREITIKNGENSAN